MVDSRMKKYPMTISKHLDKVCTGIVDGDTHFRGNRNQFYIEAIELAVVRKLGAGALDPNWVQPEVKKCESEPPSPKPKLPVVPAPSAKEKKFLEKKYAPPPVTEKAPETRGRKAILEWREGAIRDAQGRAWELTHGPALMSGETREQQFERCKTMPGVKFSIFTREDLPKEMEKEIVIQSGMEWEGEE